jgi:cation/acetate symporter
MDLQTLSILAVGFTFLIYIGIAIWARAGSTSDFYVAGKGVHPVVNGMATAADWMSAASFISMAGLIAFLGLTGGAYLMGWTGGYVLMALLLAPYLRKFGKFTVPEFIGDRFYSQTARTVAVICLLVISITYVIGQMRGVGIAFSNILQLSIEMGLVTGMAIVFVYAVFGGMKGITYTQVAQYIIMIFAYTLPAVFISLTLTGHVFPQIGLGSTLQDDPENRFLLQALDQTLVDLGFGSYTQAESGRDPAIHNDMTNLNYFLLTLSLMIGTAGLPHVIIRFFTVPKMADARSSAGWTLVFIALLYTVAPAVAAMAAWNLTNTLAPGDPTQNEFMALEERPDWMLRWERTGLLVFEDKNEDGLIQYYNERALAEDPALAAAAEEFNWQGNELVRIDNDIMVLANPEIAGLPDWVIAIVAAGGIAAALSTAAGLLLAISSAVSHDLLKGVFMPNISPKNELLAARISMAGAILLAGYLGLNPPGFAAQVVALAFGLAAASLFPALMMGIFMKRVNKEGAIAGMLVGLISTCLYIFIYKGFFFIPGTNLLPDNLDGWFLGINPSSFGVIGAILNFGTAIIVSQLTAEPPERIQELVEDVRVPRGATGPIEH